MFGQPLRTAGVGRAGIQDRFHQGELGRAVGLVRTRHHVADHPDVGLEPYLVGVKALDQIDAQCAQLVAHGGVDPGVAAGDLVARLAGQGCDTAHERAADAQDVDMHGG